MKLDQFKEACKIAFSGEDLSDVDMKPLFGCYLADFQPVIVDIKTVAAMIRHLCLMMNGKPDEVELQHCRKVFVWPSRRVEIL